MISYKSGSLLIPPTPLDGQIVDALKLPNPQHAQVQKMRMRGKQIQQVPEFVYAHRRLTGDKYGWLAVPRAVNGDLSGITGQLRTIDKTTFPDRRPITITNMESRQYQADAVDAFIAAESGIVEAPCGAGKTAIGMQAIARINTPTLILVHTRDLLSQWMQRLNSCLSPAPREYEAEVHTVQSVVKTQWEERCKWAQRFGLVIMDEAHHVPAETFSDVISSIPARYRLALTATPERPDGLTQLLHWHFGETVYRVDRDQLRDAGQIVTPTVQMIDTGYEADPSDWTKMLTDMSNDPRRNQIIIDNVRALAAIGHKTLIITERVDHAKGLAERLSDDSICAEALTGSMPKKRREAVIAEATAGNVDVLCATQLADEGLDMPRLSAIVLAMPVSKAINRVEQRVGRIMRPHPDKISPVVLDLVDDAGSLVGLAWKRIRKVYRVLGCDVYGMEKGK